MAQPIDTNPVVLEGEEAKRVFEKIQRPDQSEQYRKKMDDCFAFFLAVENRSEKNK